MSSSGRSKNSKRIFTIKEVNEMPSNHLYFQSKKENIINPLPTFKYTNSILNKQSFPRNDNNQNISMNSNKIMNNKISLNSNNITQNLIENAPQGNNCNAYINSLNKLTKEFDEYKEAQKENNKKLTMLENYYFPYEKDPPHEITSHNFNYRVMFIFKIGNSTYLFIKRTDKEFKVFYYWAREEDAIKYGIVYNELNIPGVFFDTFDNFDSFSQIKNNCAQMQEKINDQLLTINKRDTQIGNMTKENQKLYYNLKLNRLSQEKLEMNISKYQEENQNLSKGIVFLQERLSQYDEENKSLKSSLVKITKQYNRGKSFYSIDNLDQVEFNLIIQKVESFSLYQSEDINLEEKISHLDLNERFKSILVKLRSDYRLKEQEYLDEISRVTTEKSDTIALLELEIETLQLENKNAKSIIDNLKYIIELKESENKKIEKYEKEILNLKAQLIELNKYNNHYNEILKEKESIIEEKESKMKELIIKIKEKENQIEDYVITIKNLKEILAQNKIIINSNIIKDNSDLEQSENGSFTSL